MNKQGEYTTKIDMLDMLIETLCQHEEELDGLVERLEKAVEAAERR